MQDHQNSTFQFILDQDLNAVDWRRVVSLFVTINWKTRFEEEIKNAFGLSSTTIFVYEKEKLIGFGRTISDGRYYAMLADIVVDPDYQGRGIGKQIVKQLNDQLQGYHFVNLSAAPGADKFYKSLGWKKQKTAYIFPQGPKQLRQHCEPE